jgi:hypothetical protein
VSVDTQLHDPGRSPPVTRGTTITVPRLGTNVLIAVSWSLGAAVIAVVVASDPFVPTLAPVMLPSLPVLGLAG